MVVLYRLISVISFVGGFALGVFITTFDKLGGFRWFIGLFTMYGFFHIGRYYWWIDYETPSSILTRDKQVKNEKEISEQ